MRRSLQGALLVLLAAAAVVVGRGLHGGIETELLALGGSRVDWQLQALARHTAGLFRVLAADDECARRCRELIAEPGSGLTLEPEVTVEQAYDLLRTHSRGILGAAARRELQAGNYDRIRRRTLRRDYAGLGLFPKADDPNYFLNDFVVELSRFRPEATGSGLILTGRAAPGAPGVCALIELARRDDRVKLSGAPFHTELATASTRREVNLLGGISLVIVFALGWVLFRSGRFIVSTALALAAGFLAGAAAVFLCGPVCGRPHAVTFLFGTSLIGLGVDYCYHALHGCRWRELTGAFATTALAFSPLAFSSVGVLRQMAVFTIAGLATIWLFVSLWFVNAPRLRP